MKRASWWPPSAPPPSCWPRRAWSGTGNVTAYPAQDVYRELNEAGAHIVKDENVVLDGNMLTANGPGAAMLFGYSIGEYLGEDLQVAQLKEQMCYTGL